ncbi:MlaA family lipoprotein [Amylibacter sp.]|nr:MlaA family lipoprotein [Amylibacter sp.]
MQNRLKNLINFFLLILISFVISACSQSAPNEFYDPLEKINRKTHSFNKSLDKLFLRPASKVYGVVVSDFADVLINNFTNNLSEPSNAANHLLQGNLKSSSDSTARFLVNTTIGIGGITDPATRLGLSAKESDFGKTLHSWALRKALTLNFHFMQPQLFVTPQALLLILLWTLLIQLFRQNTGHILRAQNSLNSQEIEMNMAILSTICFIGMKIVMPHKGYIIFKGVDLI